MAEETPISPITAAEPPKANPLAKPAATHTSTLKLKPVIRKPAVSGTGATQSALRPGLKLPPKPGVATAGLKLPPKPGVVTAGLKLPPKPGVATAGLKLPPKPGATVTALRPGIKLPTKPVIRKPGSTVTTAPLPKPAASAAPVAELKPVEPPAAPVAELKPVEPPAVPVAELKPVEPPAVPVAELKPVEPPAVPVAETKKSETGALDALKVATQSLKSATAPIPAQAILRKTGIIADQSLSEAQKQAAKAKTSRISLSEAMGVAPVKNENAPMKTIRIKRPADISGVAGTAKPPVAAPAAAVDTQAETVVSPAASAAAKPATVTQRKTLKISRPGTGAVRPAGKFGVNKTGMTTVAKKPSATAVSAPTAPADGAVADIPDIPDMPAVAPMPTFAPAAADTLKDVPMGVAVMSVLVQTAACIAMGALAWFLYQDALIY